MSRVYETVIVGAGAAGLMTAITLARQGISPYLLDSKEKIGAKILMSGGTRCNVTNQKVSEQDFESESRRTVRNILSAFPPDRVVEFFNGLGVEMVLEDGGKYFPTTHSGRTILESLLAECCRLKVILETNCKAQSVRFDRDHFILHCTDKEIVSKTVVLSTGGFSYPSTGSDGSGYALAQSLGHSLVKTTAALTPLKSEDKSWRTLSGVSLKCRLVLYIDGKRRADYTDSFLFTHFGFSGPGALNISRHWIRNLESNPLIEVNFLPDLREETFRDEWLKAIREHPDWSVKRWLSAFFPESFAAFILMRCDIETLMTLNQLTGERRKKILNFIYRTALPVSDVFGYSKAEVTAGGVSLQEIDYRTMESKILPGLFLAGEILDADGRIGGFNFQWAWATGFLAGQSLAKKIKKSSS